jgi:hypothetical protein
VAKIRYCTGFTILVPVINRSSDILSTRSIQCILLGGEGISAENKESFRMDCNPGILHVRIASQTR